MNDSYSSLERKLLTPVRRVLRALFVPIVRVLAVLRVPPNAVSFSQVILGVVVVALIPLQPRAAFILFVVALAGWC